MTLTLLMIAVLLLAWANGSNDNFKATATLYGSNTVSYRDALGIASFAQLAGSMASVLLAGALLKAFSGKGLVPPAVVGDPAFLTSVAVGAAGTVLLATRVGVPISTTHALIGGLVGAGVALAPGELAWARLGSRYFLPLAFSPLLAMTAAGSLYPLASRYRERAGWHKQTCLCVGEITGEVETPAGGTMAFKQSGRLLTVSESSAREARYDGQMLGFSAQGMVDTAHGLSTFALGFARGLNDTPKVLALLVAAGWSGLDPQLSLGIVALAMAAGGLLMSRRIAETLGHRITTMNRGQGLMANTVSSVVVIGASLLGSPVSTTHISTGAIFGIGLHTGSADWTVVTGIVFAWIATLPTAALLSGAAAYAL